MAKKLLWTAERDAYLLQNFCLTNEELAKNLSVSTSSVKKRYLQLGVDRPSGQVELSRARNKIYRDKLRGVVPDAWFDLHLTRSDARGAGSAYYWDGQPCDRRGHISRRKAFSGGCLECELELLNERRANDADFQKRQADLRKIRYQANREEYLMRQREYKDSDRFREWARVYQKNKRDQDLHWLLRKALRDRFYKALTRGAKIDSAIRLVGCSMNDFQRYIESLFLEGMSWENYGDWHIDHIRPCISFDLADPEQQRECFHYKNLRPLWGFENRSKGGVWNGYDPRGKRPNKSRDVEVANEIRESSVRPDCDFFESGKGSLAKKPRASEDPSDVIDVQQSLF